MTIKRVVARLQETAGSLETFLKALGLSEYPILKKKQKKGTWIVNLDSDLDDCLEKITQALGKKPKTIDYDTYVWMITGKGTVTLAYDETDVTQVMVAESGAKSLAGRIVDIIDVLDSDYRYKSFEISEKDKKIVYQPYEHGSGREIRNLFKRFFKVYEMSDWTLVLEEAHWGHYD